MKDMFFILAALCLFASATAAQTSDATPPTGLSGTITGSGPALPAASTEDADRTISGFAAAGYAVQFIRQYDALNNDVSFAAMLGAELPLADIGGSLALGLRPSFLYTSEAALVDIGVSLRWEDLPSVLVGIGADVREERMIAHKVSSALWYYVLERDDFAKRLFAQIGLRYTYRRMFIELQHRTELQKGVHAYWKHPGNNAGDSYSTGYRRHFILVLLLGVRL
ncbi:MAG: hypothetical protein M5R41_01020 [Bacteroidia bacterium]|nr:hypothetical protein [Bacteroidia bacterium]